MKSCAWARVAAASALAATRCVRDACRGKLGESVDACLSADRGGAIGRARQRTVIVGARKCKQAPPFGPQNAQEVNDAFAGLFRLKAVFGANLAGVLQTTATDPAAAGCQIAIAKGLAAVTLAQVAEFNRCKQFKARHHKASALTPIALQTCVGVDTGRLSRAQKAADALVTRKCNGVTLATVALTIHAVNDAATAADGCGRPLARARPSRPSTRGAQAPRYSVEYIYAVTKAHVATQAPGRYGHISCCRLTRAKVNGGTP